MRRFSSTLLALSLLTTAAHAQAPAETLSLPLAATVQALTMQGGASVPCTAGGPHVTLADACLTFPDLTPEQLRDRISAAYPKALLTRVWGESGRIPGTLLNLWKNPGENRAVWIVPAASGRGSVIAFWTPSRTEPF